MPSPGLIRASDLRRELTEAHIPLRYGIYEGTLESGEFILSRTRQHMWKFIFRLDNGRRVMQSRLGGPAWDTIVNSLINKRATLVCGPRLWQDRLFTEVRQAHFNLGGDS